jgi:imidazolonepropionase-like amidohydrolase
MRKGRSMSNTTRSVWSRGAIAPTVMLVVLATATSAQQPTPASAPKGEAAKSSTAVAALVFKGVTVVDVQDGRLLPDQTVVVAGNRVRAVGRDRDVRPPEGAQVVDGRGKYLIPGLWDMHVHVQTPPEATHARFIANGVTGVRQMTGHGRGLNSLLQWRREIAAGTRVGPRIIGTGGSLHNKSAVKIRSVKEGRHVVDSLKAAGADFVKFHEDQTAPEIYFAVAARAREIGIPLYGHLPNTVTEIQASDSGQRTVEHYNEIHCWWPTDAPPGGSLWPPSSFPPPDSAKLKQCADVGAAFGRNTTYFVPTLTVANLNVRGEPSLERAQQIVKLLHQSGAPILTGTDSPVGTISPGSSLHTELALLVRGGLTPLDALRAATLNPAKLFNATDTLGTIAPGKLADLVLLDADPLSDIHNTTKIRAVVTNGRYFDRPALDTLSTGAAGNGP